MPRYSLSYTTPKGTRVRLFNLSESAVREIERVQKALGSSDFRTEEQERHYSQEEIDLIRQEEERQREHDAADASLRLVFGTEYQLLSPSDARNVRSDYLLAFREDGCTASQYRDRIGKGNLQEHAKSIRELKELARFYGIAWREA